MNNEPEKLLEIRPQGKICRLPEPPTAEDFIFAANQAIKIRDYFAAAALAHIPALLDAKEENKSVKNIAAWAYEMADAMLKERNKPE